MAGITLTYFYKKHLMLFCVKLLLDGLFSLPYSHINMYKQVDIYSERDTISALCQGIILTVPLTSLFQYHQISLSIYSSEINPRETEKHIYLNVWKMLHVPTKLSMLPILKIWSEIKVFIHFRTNLRSRFFG